MPVHFESPHLWYSVTAAQNKEQPATWTVLAAELLRNIKMGILLAGKLHPGGGALCGVIHTGLFEGRNSQ